VTRTNPAASRRPGVAGSSISIPAQPESARGADERLEREFATLAALAATTSHHRSPAEIAHGSLEVLARATAAEGGLIVTLENEQLSVVASIGLSDTTVELIERVGRLGDRLGAAVASSSSVAVVSLADAPFRDEIKASVGSDGLGHLLFTGLWVAGRLVGLIGLAWRSEPLVRPSDSAMVQAAALVAAAVEHARVDARLNRAYETERTITTGLQTLIRLTRLTAAARDERSFAELALGEIARTLGATGGILARIEGDVLEPLAVRELHPAFELLRAERPASEWGFVRRLRDGEGPYIGPFGDTVTTASADAARLAGYQTYAVVPVRTEEGLDEVLVLLFAEPADRLPIDARTLGAVERILEIAIANQRLRLAVAGNERRYRSLFASSPVGLIVCSADGLIVEANAAAESTYGYGRGEMVGIAMRTLSADRLDEIASRGADVAEVGGGRFEANGRRQDRSTFPAEITIAGFDLDSLAQYVLMVRDLSDQRRLEDELVQAQKMEAIGTLVAGVAHELNNPLASIVGFSQLIRDDPALPRDLRENAELLVGEADRTRHIVQNLLDFARRRPPERVPTRLRSLVENVVELSGYSLHAADVEVSIEIPARLPPVPIDRPQLQQVLLNLTTNSVHAIRSTGKRGRIVYRARRLGGHAASIRLSVIDDGPGIAEELRDRLFVPFVTTKPPGEGTGLGLSVSFGIVASHGGRITFEPGPRGGATFHVDLPTRDAAGASLDAVVDRGHEDAAEARPTAVAASPRVLVLDDEPAIRTYLRKALRGNGFIPVVVATGPEAIAAVRAGDVAAILCDYRMAGMNGIEVFEAVTAIRPELEARFVFMSGDVLNPDLHAFATARGIGLLSKPFDLATVARVVREAAAA
jgi:PAS domain S-box-containing protein